jgi:hypothetical protein
MLMSVRTLGIRIDATDILGGIWMTQLIIVLLTRSCQLIGCEGQLSKPSPRLTSEISVEILSCVCVIDIVNRCQCFCKYNKSCYKMSPSLPTIKRGQIDV